jgi:DNA-binding NarL/FixJ family response regulator
MSTSSAPYAPAPAASCSKTPGRSSSCRPSTRPPTGDALIAPNVTRRLLATFADQAPVVPVQPIDPLTEREEEVLALVARGRTNAEIATELFVGLSTVKTHVASLMTKLGARNRVEIAMWAYDTRRVRAD